MTALVQKLKQASISSDTILTNDILVNLAAKEILETMPFQNATPGHPSIGPIVQYTTKFFEFEIGGVKIGARCAH